MQYSEKGLQKSWLIPLSYQSASDRFNYTGFYSILLDRHFLFFWFELDRQSKSPWMCFHKDSSIILVNYSSSGTFLSPYDKVFSVLSQRNFYPSCFPFPLKSIRSSLEKKKKEKKKDLSIVTIIVQKQEETGKTIKKLNL